ncbi:polysaccharide deacetylase family protein [Microbacterium sp. SA39]|uniref:polysaccharide deacetylase family protein n=1 Tax=Microbacterium sp. SA39 TaxID=1263625 RepID=UPI00061F7069|nr:polysaccharide deacetylase family protein [Microbacterium sp. SA39]KJQ54548.1 Poly-beta-1,6-N-acetyl-D-glucosamine N-deacetylase precursor [Microbacterium sp. SA39]
MVVIIVSAVVVVSGGGALAVLAGMNAASAGAGPQSTATSSSTPAPSPEPTPLTPAEQLLADANNPLACAVSFAGDGIAEVPMLQWQNGLYVALPIPAKEGFVFAGWYPSADDAAAFTSASRINGADPVSCTDQQIELHGAWKTPEENLAEHTQVPILMYHQFTANPDGESGWLRGNYAYTGDFDAQMNHIATTGFYLPTWDELSAFIDGRLHLPARSVIITDDDADQTWFDLAVPVIERHHLLSTSFMVTAYRSDPPPSIYVLRRSHTHDMHQAGANGKGRIVNWSVEEIAADLNASGDTLGVREVIAYPFGHYNDTAKQGVLQAGFQMARTIEPGYVGIGTDKLALPVVRIDYGMGLESLIKRIG